MGSNLTKYENSQTNGQPFEVYKFTCDHMDYLYTSRARDVTLTVDEKQEIYRHEYIEHDDVIPGNDANDSTMIIRVKHDNPVAMLFKGAPPESDVSVKLMRLHEQDKGLMDVLYNGRIEQVSFQNSVCEITVALQDYLDKELPRACYQYFCNHVLYSEGCGLEKAAWETTAAILNVDGLKIYSDDFAGYPDGYFTDGVIVYDGARRRIEKHTGNCCVLIYPFETIPYNQVQVTAGCDKKFSTCIKKFNNAIHFFGFPYIPPTDSEKNPTGKGVYWIDSEVVQRDTNGFVGMITT